MTSKNVFLFSQEIFSFFQIALHFVDQTDESTPADVLLIKTRWDIVSRKKCKNIKQNKISDFFYNKIVIEYCLFTL